ncbi:MAG: hypothetical protein IPO12_01840 [Flavobacteriales bacterium]|nr:hypothetical protein [Flavobacteriales bacterium]
MSKITVKAKALWIDDEYTRDGKVIAQDFIDNAAEAGIIIVPFDNTVDGLAELEKRYLDFDAIILDAWGRLAKGKKGDDPTALGNSNDMLHDLAMRKHRSIPACIYSGHMGDLESTGGKAPKFDKHKGTDLDKLLAWVIEQAERRDENVVIAKHSEVFKVFDENLLPGDKKWELVKLLLEADGIDAATIKANNALARTFIDAILDGLNTESASVMPAEFQTGTKWNMTYAKMFLTGKEVELRDRMPRRTLTPPGQTLPEHLGWMLGTIVNTPSSTGSHDYREKHTQYAHRAVVNALCELLIWYHDFIMSKRKK